MKSSIINHMRRIFSLIFFLWVLFYSKGTSAQDFTLGPEGYFRNEGIDVMAFYDFYPEGHQGGVCVIMNGKRIATNGDLRFEATPGQWQPSVWICQRRFSPLQRVTVRTLP